MTHGAITGRLEDKRLRLRMPLYKGRMSLRAHHMSILSCILGDDISTLSQDYT